MTFRTLLLGSAATGCALTLSLACQAQTAQSSPPPDANAAAVATRVSGVTVTAKAQHAAAVTATKTDAPITETPVSVQVVSQQTLQDQGVIGIDAALKNVSGVTVGSGGAADNGQPFSAITIRGFGSDSHFRDGVRLDSFGGDSGTESIQLANVESVTVLKGPAAILYGAVEPGGIVNIVTKQPQATPAYSITQQFGSYALYRTVVDATGPLTGDGKLLYRLDGSYEDAGSPTKFIYNRTPFVASAIAWLPNAKDRVTLEGEYKFLNYGQNYGYMPTLNGLAIENDIATNYGENSPAHERTFLVDLTWAHQFNDRWSLRQSALLNNVKNDAAGIFPLYLSDPSPVPTPSGASVGRVVNNVYGNDYTISENFDLVGHVSALGVKNTLLVGGDYVRFDYRGGIYQAGQIDDNISYIDLIDPVHPGTPFAPGRTIFISDNQSLDTAGFYMQDQATLPGRLHVLAGFRVQYVDQNSSLAFAGGPQAPAPRLIASAVTPRVGLLWQARDWAGLYFSYAGSFGPNNGYSILPTGGLVPPTSAHQYEVGVKTSFWGGRLTASAAFYDLTKTNIPTPDPLNQAFSLVIGEANSTGVELDVQGELAPGWTVIANYAYDDARVTRASSIDTNTPVGSPFGEVPANEAHLWTTYEFRSGPARGVKLGAGATYNGSEPYLYAGLTPPYIPAYQTFDLMASYAFKIGATRMTAQINATNILDRRYFSDIQAAGFPATGPYGAETALFGAPRMVIGSLRADF